MTAAIVLIAIVVAVLVLREALRDSPDGQMSHPPAPRTPLPRTRFSGRLVEPAAPAARAVTPRPRRPRLQNGERVTAVRNGRTVTPPDAIGLGCLLPISQCTLGDQCVCLNQSEGQSGGHL